MSKIKNAASEKAEAIRAELRRLGADCTRLNPTAIVVVPTASLPSGWVRIYDDNAEVFGPADDFLAALRVVQREDDASEAYEAVWQALSGASQSDEWPAWTQDWKSAGCLGEPILLADFERSLDVAIVEIKTNLGPRYLWGADDCGSDLVYDFLSDDDMELCHDAAEARRRATLMFGELVPR